jgi:hypothetical protein
MASSKDRLEDDRLARSKARAITPELEMERVPAIPHSVRGLLVRLRHLSELPQHYRDPQNSPYLLRYLHLRHQLDYTKGREEGSAQGLSKGQNQRLGAYW